MQATTLHMENGRQLGVARYQWVDYAKGIAIILVVYRHMLYGLQHTGLPVAQWIIDGNNMLFSFRMPLFFLLSGLFFQAGLKKRGPAGLLADRTNNLLYPYIIWAAIQITLQIVFSRFANADRSLWSYAEIFIQPRSLDQLWYLFALFNVTALYLFNHSIARFNTTQQLLLGLVFLGLAPWAVPVSTCYDVMLHYIFFSIGVAVAPSLLNDNAQQQLAQGKYLLLLLPVFAYSQWYFLLHQQLNLFLYAVIALVGSLFMILLSAWLAKFNVLGVFKIIGTYSLYIYLLHVMLAAVLRSMLIKCGIHNVPVLLLLLIAGAIPLSVLVYKTMLKYRLGWLFKGPFKVKKANV
ncbi:acyltransferase family protein [Chitinophaga sp. Cy-1792]|uniref:acyltransferase family protein n=1 Tax=Chitinophaga sp. Cy-1792 TaxID=2608339 RepID=UPI0014232975|nr:acyltransferase family protein [Chitinophaga sp. Cy-1792]NIG56319.1 acyltransferase [Chitinophaga sp. Cy-1792]